MRGEEDASGTHPTVKDTSAPTVDSSCHEIIDAATALATNVELLAGLVAALDDAAPIVIDVRASIERIVNIARALRGGASVRRVPGASACEVLDEQR